MTSTTPAALAATTTGTGPGLVLLHGGGASAEVTWGPLLDRFASNFTVLAPDLPGSGQTPAQDERLNLDDLSDRVVATADAAGLHQFRLVGFSLSSSVAIHTAARHPDRVLDLIVIAGFAQADNHLRLALDVWDDLLDDPPLQLGRFLACAGTGPEFIADLSSEQLDTFAQSVGESVAPGTRAQLDLARRVDVRDDLAHVTARTLVIGMNDDGLALPARSDEIHRGITTSRRAELPGGHVPMVEYPEQLVALMIEFMIDGAT